MLTTTIGSYPKPAEVPVRDWFRRDDGTDRAEPTAGYAEILRQYGARLATITIEDAHCPNDLSLLEGFTRTKVILGVMAIGRSRVEEAEEVREHLRAALEHIEAERLIAAPDCGLGLLGRDLARQKLEVLTAAAHSL
jgi:methionine synthase II (cobalamin-independent)